jgi:hypothetical protein
MKDAFSWFVANPHLYYVAALTTLLGFASFAIGSSKLETLTRKAEWLFLGLAGATVLVWRLPILLWPQPMNIDEGQWTACALKAAKDLAPWRGFDATTSGPLNADVLALPALFGGQITFFSTRLIGIALVMGAIYGFYFGAKWTLEAASARIALVAPILFLALTGEWDFIHYSSEELPLFLTTIGIAAGAYLTISPARTKAARICACLLGGVFLGSAGFAKLQALPVAAAGAVFIAAVIWQTASSAIQRWRELAALAGSLALVPGLVTISLLSTGHWNDAVISYLYSAVVHVASGSTVDLQFFFSATETYAAFAAGSLFLILTCAVILLTRWRFTRRSKTIAFCSVGFVVVSVFVILAPRHGYPHYLLFSVLPLTYAVATVLAFTRQTGIWTGKEAWLSAAVTGLFLVPALGFSMTHPCPFVGEVRKLRLRADATFVAFQDTTPQVHAIHCYAPPGTLVSIWGWMPHYYVQTQTIMATRDAHTKPQQTPGPYQEYFRQRYLTDLRVNRPAVFVDAVAPNAFGYDKRATEGMESFPALAAFIDENYLLKEEVLGVRIYVLNSANLPPQAKK